MPSLPALDTKTQMNHSPHVVILGAGASIASTIRNPEKYGKLLPGMANLVDTLGLEPLINRYGLTYNGQNFEAFYDGLSRSGRCPELLAELEQAIYGYFSDLKLPDEVTLYDYLVLSLREKDIIATFNWDPFLAQAFARNMHVVGYERMPQIAFLHGNVAIGVCYDCKTMGWRRNGCTKCSNDFNPSKLLYPVGKKDYASDEFIVAEWERLKWHMQRAYYVTVFGYSAPRTDAEARTMLLDEWQANPVQELSEIDIVDILKRTDRPALESNWKEFFVRSHYGLFDSLQKTQLFYHPRRTCDAFAMATLQCRPWAENTYPEGLSLVELQDWIQPLIKEEAEGMFSGKTCEELRKAQ
ncbi:hypothetical protein [Alcanivorax sediminis]|uniref:Uncharacterized protein n=1 Tax=Alcanivorax sediminis TaxID=2663008 RepID=A0A6N7LW62_9GAMM|nr:hypothetical protein [Alcanivorax sediminis]MQX52360.1 hypothetical protein [Alcanivorax sediminis]